MAYEGWGVQKHFSKSVDGITRLSRGNSPIARAYQGIRNDHQNGLTVYLQVAGRDYQFAYNALEGSVDDGCFYVDAHTKDGVERVPLSYEAIDYIDARIKGDFVNLMELNGIVGGYYGHNPDPNANGSVANPAFVKE